MNHLHHGQENEQVGAYVLDALPPAEVAAFQAHLATCAECRSEVAQLRAVVDILPLAVTPVEPPASLRARVMSAVESDVAPRAPLTALAGGAPKREPRRNVFKRVETYLSLAAVAVIAALGLWNSHLQSQVNQQQAAVNFQQLLASALNRHAAVYPVAPTTSASGASAYAVQPQNNQTAYLIVKDLPHPAANKVYQLWLMKAGVPTSEGTFTYSGNGPRVIRMQTQLRGYGVTAVTVENGPGGSSHGPTGAKVLVGKLGA